MINCNEIKENLHDYIDNLLDKQTVLELDAHLKDCESCQSELDFLSLIKGTASDIMEEPPCSITDRVLSEIKTKKEKRRKAILRFPLYAGGAAAACFIMFVAINIFMHSNLNFGVNKSAQYTAQGQSDNSKKGLQNRDYSDMYKETVGNAPESANVTADNNTEQVPSRVDGAVTSDVMGSAVEPSKSVSSKAMTSSAMPDGATLTGYNNTRKSIDAENSIKLLSFISTMADRAENISLPKDKYDTLIISLSGKSNIFSIKNDVIFDMQASVFKKGNAVKLTEKEAEEIRSYFK